MLEKEGYSMCFALFISWWFYHSFYSIQSSNDSSFEYLDVAKVCC